MFTLRFYSIDLTKSGNMQYIQSNTAKFYGEIERGVAELYICDADLLTGETSTEDYDPDEYTIALTYENMFSDIGKALKMPEYNGKLRIDLKDTGFVYDAKWENSCPDTLAFSVRRRTRYGKLLKIGRISKACKRSAEEHSDRQ